MRLSSGALGLELAKFTHCWAWAEKINATARKKKNRFFFIDFEILVNNGFNSG